MRIEIEGIHKVRRKLADGSYRTHYYAWRGGPAMKSDPDTDEFLAEYTDHVERKNAPRDTLEALIENLTGTDKKPNPDFTKLAQSTQTDHLYAFEIIKDEWPMLPIKLTQKRGMKSRIRDWHKSFKDNPRKADKLLFSLSKVFSYAIECDLVDKNPCSGIRRLYEGSRRNSIWTPDLIERFRLNAPAQVLAPFEVAYHTGQRQSDVLGLKWADYDGVYLYILQGKGKVRVKVRVHPKLKIVLDALPRASIYILTNSRGRPWTVDGFKTSWGKSLKLVGITGLTFHDLRGTFITERSREGSTAIQISSISGHSLSEVNSVLTKNYLADDQQASDAVILRMEKNQK